MSKNPRHLESPKMASGFTTSYDSDGKLVGRETRMEEMARIFGQHGSFGFGPPKMNKKAEESNNPLKKRFDRIANLLNQTGVLVGTAHKRILIPKDKLTEKDIKSLGFVPVSIAIPEAGQDRFSSFRHPDTNFHIHSHPEGWTMHEDRHAASTMLARKAKGALDKTKALVSGLPHVNEEGIPGLYYYVKGVLGGHTSTAQRVLSELPKSTVKRIESWKPSLTFEGNKMKTASLTSFLSELEKISYTLAQAQQLPHDQLSNYMASSGMEPAAMQQHFPGAQHPIDVNPERHQIRRLMSAHLEAKASPGGQLGQLAPAPNNKSIFNGPGLPPGSVGPGPSSPNAGPQAAMATRPAVPAAMPSVPPPVNPATPAESHVRVRQKIDINPQGLMRDLGHVTPAPRPPAPAFRAGRLGHVPLGLMKAI